MIWIDPQLPAARTRIQALADVFRQEDILPGGLYEVFEAVGRHQFIKLIELGLLPESRVLDVGCGVLRAGYWLIHFLRPGCYFGIEPSLRDLEAGQRVLLTPELLAEKRPSFDRNDQFDFSVFGTKFDFVLARSVWSHASLSEIDRMLEQFALWGEAGSVFITSWIRTDDPAMEYPGSKRFLDSTLRGLAEKRGLIAQVEETVQLQTWMRIMHP